MLKERFYLFISTVRGFLTSGYGSCLSLKPFNREVRVFILKMHNFGEYNHKSIFLCTDTFLVIREIIDQEIKRDGVVPLFRCE